MLKLGLTSAALTDMPREAAEPYEIRPNATIDEMETVLNSLIITATGRVRKQFSLAYTEMTKTEYETIRAYCYPYSVQEYYAQITNGVNDTLFDSFAFVRIGGESVDYNASLYTFTVTVTEL